MKRRDIIQYAGAGACAALGLGISSRWQETAAQTNESVTIQWLGHTCFLFTGSGRRILVNPFRPLGCTAGYRTPTVAADLVMVSSRLLDEGVTEGLPGNPRILSDAGVYEFSGMQVQGIQTDHDDLGGRRFGTNTVWRWNQGGLVILHLGGMAAPITVEQRILMGRADVVLIPVGGGAKAYTPEEAAIALRTLSPKIVIPTHYRTAAANEAACDISSLDNFLTLVEGTPVRQGGNSITLRTADLPETGSVIQVFNYSF